MKVRPQLVVYLSANPEVAPFADASAGAIADMGFTTLAVDTEGCEVPSARHRVTLPRVDEALSPLPLALPLQLLGYRLALATGIDPDVRAHLKDDEKRFETSRRLTRRSLLGTGKQAVNAATPRVTGSGYLSLDTIVCPSGTNEDVPGGAALGARAAGARVRIRAALCNDFPRAALDALSSLGIDLDEPFNALDAKLRYSMQVELRKLVKNPGITTIFVTHDQSEALTLSDRVAVMQGGEIEPVAAPLGVYDTPASDYVADFIGSANDIAGEARAGSLGIAPGVALASQVEGRAVAIVRPENLRAEPVEGDAGAGWYGRVGFVRALGATVEYEIEVPGREAVKVLALRLASDRVLELGQRVRISLRDPDACPVLPAPAS